MAKIRTTKLVKLDTIQTHPENYNQGDAGAISVSLDENGQFRAIVVSEATGNILAGNHTYLAAKMNGEKQMLAHLLVADDGGDLSPEEEIRILVADNGLAKLAMTDDHKLSELLKGLHSTDRGLTGIGYDGDDLDAILADVWPKATFEEGADGVYTRKVESPIYEPTGDKPAVQDLTDRTYTNELQTAIADADLPAEVAEFLTYAAERHTVFQFDKIANYYAHADADTQALMEASALVIIDFEQAIERGFVKLNEQTETLFKGEHPDA